MPEVTTVMAESPALAVEPPRRGMAPGTGEFVSRNGRLYAARRPKYRQIRNPLNMERWIDVPETNDKGEIVYIDDPAAVQTIQEMSDGKDTSIPTMKFPEPHDDVKEQIKELTSAMRISQETSQKTLETLAAVVGMLVDQFGHPIRKEK